MPFFSGLVILTVVVSLIGLLIAGIVKRSRRLIVTAAIIGAILIALNMWSSRSRPIGSFSCQGIEFSLYAVTGFDEVDVSVKIQAQNSEPQSHRLLFWPCAGLPPTTFEACYSPQKQALWFITEVPSESKRDVAGSYVFRTGIFEKFTFIGSSGLDKVPPDAAVVARIGTGNQENYDQY
jgi:hypothetical protein